MAEPAELRMLSILTACKVDLSVSQGVKLQAPATMTFTISKCMLLQCSADLHGKTETCITLALIMCNNIVRTGHMQRTMLAL